MGKALSGVKVLVVEDDRDLGCLTRIVLEEEGAQVRVAHTASDALTAIGSFSPEIALLDSRLPDMTGRVLSHHLQERVSSCVQILVSGDAAEVEHWSQVGGHALSKPYDLDEFLGVLVRALRATC